MYQKRQRDAHSPNRERIASAASTVAHDAPATMMRLPFLKAAITPMTMAAAPAMGDLVACTIAGNVITESVTYGT